MTSVVRGPRRKALSLACSFLWMLGHALPASAQKKPSDATGAVVDATKKGFPLTTSSTDVTGNISVEATLIPAKIAKTVFGKEVAKNYAVIVLTISNRSSDDSFIVHTVFIDYSQWLLSGSSPYVASCAQAAQGDDHSAGQKQPGQAETQQAAQSQSGQSQGQQPPPAQRQSKTAQCPGNILQPWQQQTFPNQIDSVETRIVRGELLDRQPWTTRNWVLRALAAAGSIAAGFTFATVDDGWIRGIGAYNAHFIPAVQTFWPDATIGQMNRISDVGFQVNKVIAQQSSDIVVAFFPIERFLTPGLAKIFISSPAAFFTPLAALTDLTVKKKLDPYIDSIFSRDTTQANTQGTTPKSPYNLNNLMGHLSEVVGGACENVIPATSTPATSTPTTSTPATSTAAAGSLELACQTAELVNRLSLNVVRVRVGGTMTLDVNKIPPHIDEIQIDQDQDGSTKWTKGTALTGVIRGSFLGSGTPAITGTEGKVLQISAVTEGSNDTALHFKIAMSDALPAGTTKLSFQVSKKSSDGSTVTSAVHEYTILTTPPAPANKDNANPGANTSDAAPATEPQKNAQPAGAAPATPTKPAKPTKPPQ